MKYMGSKSAMLSQGLGNILTDRRFDSGDFVDLFAGSGVVAQWRATRSAQSVTSVDTQVYSRVLSSAVLERTETLDVKVFEDWFDSCVRIHERISARYSEQDEVISRGVVLAEREHAAEYSENFFITRDYGGHYYSLRQALALDVISRELNRLSGDAYLVCRAALVAVASRCAASPGHTAQPFQPTDKLLPHIHAARSRDPFEYLWFYIVKLANECARTLGRAVSTSAALFIESSLRDESVVFCDPPYSDVQYSRFYHVLEGIAIGGYPSVSGAGRSPALEERYSSPFSNRSEAPIAFDNLLKSLSVKSSRVILTFPDHDCSNGMSARTLAQLAERYFAVETYAVSMRHSSLGGGGTDSGSRLASRQVQESVLVCMPR